MPRKDKPRQDNCTPMFIQMPIWNGHHRSCDVFVVTTSPFDICMGWQFISLGSAAVRVQIDKVERGGFVEWPRLELANGDEEEEGEEDEDDDAEE